MEKLFHHSDKNKDGYLTLDEVLIMASPDINNNKVMEESEKQIGINNAKILLACILELDDKSENKILQDNKISMSELNKYKKHPMPNLWVKGSYTPEGDLTPTQEGAALLNRANNLLLPFL